MIVMTSWQKLKFVAGTVLILAGLLLNLCVCGVLMKDLEWTSQTRKERARKAKLERGARRHRRKLNNTGSSIKSGRTNGSSADTMSNGASPYICDVEQLRKLLKTPGKLAFLLGVKLAMEIVEMVIYVTWFVVLFKVLQHFHLPREMVQSVWILLLECAALLSTCLRLFAIRKKCPLKLWNFSVPTAKSTSMYFHFIVYLALLFDEHQHFIFASYFLSRILQHNYPNLLASRSFSDSGRLNDPQHQILESHPIEGVCKNYH